jgi:hypothetical protein
MTATPPREPRHARTGLGPASPRAADPLNIARSFADDLVSYNNVETGQAEALATTALAVLSIAYDVRRLADHFAPWERSTS